MTVVPALVEVEVVVLPVEVEGMGNLLRDHARCLRHFFFIQEVDLLRSFSHIRMTGSGRSLRLRELWYCVLSKSVYGFWPP